MGIAASANDRGGSGGQPSPTAAHHKLTHSSSREEALINSELSPASD
eukprot:CAMPEP_0180663736 /NCGR_PEP_ID=MMETSP1037_2-20121125/60180_1 /TAXON_ID=632150 /ORGANISM="Azadinium spinosum, Strain 3D9" /LENGTH=46 /DNA_ID= /DNA_START= /DNA_END= /DNA_ORIENTATION=